jgi:molecular chaperone DnaK
MEISGDHFRAVATDGDVQLGGRDWDEKLVNLAAERFIAQHREDPPFWCRFLGNSARRGEARFH